MKIKLQAMDEQLITPRTGRKVVTGLLSMHNSSLVEKGRVMIMYDAKYVNDKIAAAPSGSAGDIEETSQVLADSTHKCN